MNSIFIKTTATNSQAFLIQCKFVFVENFASRVTVLHFNFLNFKKKKNFHCTRGITPKRVTSGGVHLRSVAPGNIATVASRWRHCADLTGPGIKPQTSRTDSQCAYQLN